LSGLIPLKDLQTEALGPLICYPRFEGTEYLRRLKELELLNVEALELSGPLKVLNLQVLGKGCVSIVVAAALKGGGRCALKIRRVDADRGDTLHEVEMLRRANAAGIGPTIYGYTQNFITMELIEGEPMPQWVTGLRGRGSKERLRRVLERILRQARLLDSIGLDHGELSRAPKHIIVDRVDRPHIIDFETASVKRRSSNVTALTQYLLIGSRVAREVSKRLRITGEERVIEALRRYKREPNDGNFEELLTVIGLI
jgi:putative serine/threonine protein kinase